MMMRPPTTPGPVAAILNAPGVAVISRVLLTSPFWISGLLKAFDFESAVGEAAHFGLRPAVLTAMIVLLLQLGASLAVILGQRVWLSAGALGVFTVLATLVGHAFWTLAEPMARFHDMNAFMANVGLLGGLILAAMLSERRR